jgi:hypothetical protein
MEEILGKHVLIGITRLDHAGELIRQEQHHGRVTSVGKSIHIQLSTGRDFQLPPDTRSFCRAPRGEYRLRSTGEIVVDPDFMTSWTINSPPPGFRAEKDAQSDAMPNDQQV